MIGISLLSDCRQPLAAKVSVSSEREQSDSVVHRSPIHVPLWLNDLSQREWRGNSKEYLARHSHSFRYAAQFLPPPMDEAVADIYAFCRFTDDLVDRSEINDAGILDERLAEWKRLAFAAYSGMQTGIPFLDRAMRDMSHQGISFHYADELIEGVRMDLTRHRYATMQELKLYTYRVASVVGLWLTERVGQRDPEVLKHAADLGHAMQLTNILRDVGEDLRTGRLYLPMARLAAHGLSANDILHSLPAGQPLPHAWSTLIEEIMQIAEEHYQSAIQGIPHLPSYFQKPVLTALWVYRDIHHSIRNNAYDNLHLRAYSPKWRKVVFGLGAQLSLPWMRFFRTSLPKTLPQARPALTASVATGKSAVWKAAALYALAASASGLVPAVMASERIKDLPRAEAMRLAHRDLSEVEAALKKHSDSLPLRHNRLRLLHALSVSEDSLLPTALEEWRRLSAHPEWAPQRSPLAQAYRGAFEVVKAKHALWPGHKMRHLDLGLPALDSAVQAYPQDVETRYLRLVSCYYLPFFLGRKASVQADFAALAESLPKVAGALPAPWFMGISRFVLTRGDLSDEAYQRLRQAYESMASTLGETRESSQAG